MSDPRDPHDTQGESPRTTESEITAEDTRPLKDQKPKKQKTDSAPPPGTVLKKASELPEEPGIDQMLHQGETGRMRLVPKIPVPPSWRVILQVLHPTEATLGLHIRRHMTIGRIDPDNPDSPDLDLAPYMAIEYGVSRHHAALIPGEDALYVVDLDSTNGTWINGKYLEPGQRYTLAPGDRLELGLIRFEVRTITQLNKPESSTD